MSNPAEQVEKLQSRKVVFQHEVDDARESLVQAVRLIINININYIIFIYC